MSKNKFLRSVIVFGAFGLLTVLIFMLTFNFRPGLYPAINKDVPHFAMPDKLIIVSLLFSIIVSAIISWLFFKKRFR